MNPTADLLYVGRRVSEYDFEREGERIKGTKRTAYFSDPRNGHTVHEIDVKDDLAELFGGLQFGDLYRVSAEPRARGNRVVYVLQDAKAANGVK